MVNVLINSNPKTLERANKLLKLPSNRTDKRSMKNYAENN